VAAGRGFARLMQLYVLPAADPNQSFSVNFGKYDDAKPTTAQPDAVRPFDHNLPRFTGVHWFRFATHSKFIINARSAISER
jgi:hypothetical protein